MKTSLPIAGLLLGVWLMPVTGIAADSSGKPVEAVAAPNETPGATKPNPTGTTKMRNSAHPVDDSMITTKIKGKFVADKQIRKDNIEVKTVDGVVELTGTARSKAKARHAVALARKVNGVKSVTNSIEITPPAAVAAGDPTYKDRSASTRTSKSGAASDQPVSDTWITTKVKAKLAEDKQVKGRNISVKTVNGVVQLSGFAGSADEVSKAASLAGDIKGVKSVNNDIKVQ
ncbi:MAG: BON domain-containing protein [Betaproteobacteria bacterium]|nr:BON domain-containing protein [Betaproteobacteria bacterium]